MTDRVIALLDMDCFYCQVEQRDRPELWGKPVVVVQNTQQFRGGSIIAVSYEARAAGITRGSAGLRGDDAKKICADVELVATQMERGKPVLTKYRRASAEVFSVLNAFDSRLVIERASVDEAYIDLTTYVDEQMASGQQPPKYEDLPSTCVFLPEEGSMTREESLEEFLRHAGEDMDAYSIRLAFAAGCFESIRSRILEQTQFHCSAGMSFSKTVAKLACGINKPRKQTILPRESLARLYRQTKIGKVRNLGGKLGAEVKETFAVETMADLCLVPQGDMERVLGDRTAHWLSGLCAGQDGEVVKPVDTVKSIGCGKLFAGKLGLTTVPKVREWIGRLSDELVERLKQDQTDNRRIARTLTVGIRCAIDGASEKSYSRAKPLLKYDVVRIAETAMNLLAEFNQGSCDVWCPAVHSLSISASKFDDSVAENQQITDFFVKSAAELRCAEISPNTLARNQEETEYMENNNQPGTSRELTTIEPINQENTTCDGIDTANLTNLRQAAPDVLMREAQETGSAALAMLGKHRTDEITREKEVAAPIPQVKKSPKKVVVQQKKKAKKTTAQAQSVQKSTSQGRAVTRLDDYMPSCSRSTVGAGRGRTATDRTERRNVDGENGGIDERDVGTVGIGATGTTSAGGIELPESIAEIDPETLRSLPVAIRFELQQYYRTTSDKQSRKRCRQHDVNQKKDMKLRKTGANSLDRYFCDNR